MDPTKITAVADGKCLRALGTYKSFWVTQTSIAYDFNIFFWKGKLNLVDGLSRRPDYEEHVEERDQTIFPTLRNKLPSTS